MGQSSSQVEVPTQASRAAEPVAATASPGRKRKTSGASSTASEALRRELEQSILTDSANTGTKPKRKRRKVEEILADDLDEDASREQTQAGHTIPNGHHEVITPRKVTRSGRRTEEEKDTANGVWAKAEAKKTRARLLDEAKVGSNEDQWWSLPDGKRGVKMYNKGDVPVRSPKAIAEAEQHLKSITRDIESADRSVNHASKLGQKSNAQLATERTTRTRKQLEAQLKTSYTDRVEGNANAMDQSMRKKRNKKDVRATGDAGPERSSPQVLVSRQEATEQPDERDTTLGEDEKKRAKDFPTHSYKYKPLIDTWLDGQERSKPVDKQDVERVQKVAASRKRKQTRASPYQEDDEEDRHDKKVRVPSPQQPNGPHNATSQQPDHPSYGVSNSPDPPTRTPTHEHVDAGADKGTLTDQEKIIADGVFAQIMKDHNLSDVELRAMIRDYRTAGSFKTAIHAALPRRSHDTIRKFVKRRYHAFQRGAWTTEQDDALRDMFAKWPDEWVKISEVVDRSPDDCKDRWRKQLQYGDKKENGPWSSEEEDMLASGIMGCLEKITQEYPDKVDRSEQLALLNWEAVSNSLQGRRSAKQCREKFEKIQRRGNTELVQGKGVPSRTREPTISSRYRQAKKHLRKFELGDYFDVFTEIHLAFKDHNVHFHDEDNTLWSKVAWIHQGSRFNMSRCGGALRRLALDKATEEWPKDSKHVTRRLEKATTIPAKALVFANWIERRANGNLGELPRTYKADLLDKTKDEMIQIQRERQQKWLATHTKAARRKEKKRNLSKETIENSDAEDEDEAAKDVEDGDNGILNGGALLVTTQPQAHQANRATIVQEDAEDDNHGDVLAEFEAHREGQDQQPQDDALQEPEYHSDKVQEGYTRVDNSHQNDAESPEPVVIGSIRSDVQHDIEPDTGSSVTGDAEVSNLAPANLRAQEAEGDENKSAAESSEKSSSSSPEVVSSPEVKTESAQDYVPIGTATNDSGNGSPLIAEQDAVSEAESDRDEGSAGESSGDSSELSTPVNLQSGDAQAPKLASNVNREDAQSETSPNAERDDVQENIFAPAESVQDGEDSDEDSQTSEESSSISEDEEPNTTGPAEVNIADSRDSRTLGDDGVRAEERSISDREEDEASSTSDAESDSSEESSSDPSNDESAQQSPLNVNAKDAQNVELLANKHGPVTESSSEADSSDDDSEDDQVNGAVGEQLADQNIAEGNHADNRANGATPLRTTEWSAINSKRRTPSDDEESILDSGNLRRRWESSVRQQQRTYGKQTPSKRW